MAQFQGVGERDVDAHADAADSQRPRPSGGLGLPHAETCPDGHRRAGRANPDAAL